jgi:phenylacetate-coenzyme A ligase PaaK-like adenylate-forming protein
MNLKYLFEILPYSLDKRDKSNYLNNILFELTQYHYFNCLQYQNMMDCLEFDVFNKHNYYELPMLPVRLFKMFELCSKKREYIVKTVTSSGTSGKAVSEIFLDRETAVNQSKALANIVSSVLGLDRYPMIIIDSPSIVKSRSLYSARVVGITGFSVFGTKRIYALDDNMELNTDLLLRFIADNKGRKIFLFGFTFIIYQHFIKKIKEQKISIDLSNAILIHGGGWKKLINESITSADFRNLLKNFCGINYVYDYYGMAEQTGSIYMECELGNFHTSIYSDVIIRRPYDFSVASIGEQGIIQTLSVLPRSYPGHSLLTEDIGVLMGEDDCHCGRLGKYFRVLGRIKSAELRGCSDIYAEQF